jgi:hypothetical protein
MINDKLNAVNAALKNYKRPATKQAPVARKTPDLASIRDRIADVRKQISIACEQAEKLGATKLAAQIRAFSQQLASLEASLAKASGTERKLVRMVTRFS